MINLGRAHRWKGRPLGALGRLKAALAKRTQGDIAAERVARTPTREQLRQPMDDGATPTNHGSSNAAPKASGGTT